jgi:hypothetical protein
VRLCEDLPFKSRPFLLTWKYRSEGIETQGRIQSI